jgi:hypothetical protein
MRSAPGYWFDSDGRLMKTYFSGLETRRLDFADLSEVAIARKSGVLTNELLAMQITVIQVNPAGPTPRKGL